MKLEVETTGGLVRGRARRGVALFAGIPFAAPPVGPLRWAPPEPALPWAGVRDATRFGPAAPQLPGDGLTNAHEVDWSEDCLTLNVVTPSADAVGRPVLFWIHGGAYRNGTGATPWYDGTSFALQGDIVVVSLNYRLGALGFARIEGASGGGMTGVLDQVAALGWVCDNIAAFGGDPSQVTIAGESAGAFSVATLLAMPEARGLFHRAIAQSGAGHHVLDADVAAEVAKRFLIELGAVDLEDARTRPAADVLVAQRRVEAQAGEFMNPVERPFYPSPDGHHLTQRPIDVVASGGGPDIPLLTGTNADEMTLFGLAGVTDDLLEVAVGPYADPVAPLLDVYRRELPDASAAELAVALTTDHTFRVPAIRLAEARKGLTASTWMYHFDWKSHAFGGALGATHALEIPFAFNTLASAGVDIFLGTDELPTALAQNMHRCWIEFIRSGSPGHDGIPDWPPYLGNDRAVLEFGDEIALLHDPAPSTRQAWQGLR